MPELDLQDLGLVAAEAILNLVETDSLWSLIPLGDIRKFPSGMVERGGGNAVSVEFSEHSASLSPCR